MDNAADDALRIDSGGQRAVRIDALEPAAVVRTADALKEPPRNAIHRGDDGSVGAEQRTDVAHHRGERRRFHGHDHVVLLAKITWLVGGRQPVFQGAPAGLDREAVAAQGGEVLAAGHQANLLAAFGQHAADETANRAGTVNAYPHR